jgi:hypothetical protein
MGPCWRQGERLFDGVNLRGCVRSSRQLCVGLCQVTWDSGSLGLGSDKDYAAMRLPRGRPLVRVIEVVADLAYPGVRFML